MLNKFGKKICAGVCALSFGLGLNVKSDAFLGQLVLATCEMASALRLGSVLKKFGFLRFTDSVNVEGDEGYQFSVQGTLLVCSVVFLMSDSVQRGLTAVVSIGDKKTEEPRLDDKKSNAKENK